MSLNGEWQFREDPDDRGINEHWFSMPSLGSSADGVKANNATTIHVPFPPGSTRSGVPDFHDSDIVWYSRRISATDLASGAAFNGEGAARAPGNIQGRRDTGITTDGRYILHFEGVDYHAHVWLNGHLIADHEGGFTRFHIDITPYLQNTENVLAVRACDRKSDVGQPRGKQDWRQRPHGIWYHRSTGIWRDVWIEAVPDTHIEELRWLPNIDARQVECHVTFNRELDVGSTLAVSIACEAVGIEAIARSVTSVRGRNARVILDIPQLNNPHEAEDYLWSPEAPHLCDAAVELSALTPVDSPSTTGGLGESSMRVTDTVVSYFGLAGVATSAHLLTLNEHPVYVRGVLDQGYWAESYLTPPSPHAIKRDLEIIKRLGFNTVRAHQRTPDPRYLAWADVIGLMVWVEFPAAYEYSMRSFERTMNEWTQTVVRCSTHPSVVAWVPANESWGLPQVARSSQQQAALRSLVAATRALDPTRPVIGNDGWHQLDTDVVTLHDYATNPQALAIAYRDEPSIRASLIGDGPQGRVILLEDTWQGDKPVIVSEFGGVSLNQDQDTWGYATVQDTEEFLQVLRELFHALYASPIIAGWCYTQLTDTGQETNGLCYADRTLKAPLAQLRAIVSGGEEFFAQQVRPRQITEAWRGGEDHE